MRSYLSIFLLLISFWFSACFFDSETEKAAEIKNGLFIQNFLGFSIKLPNSWQSSLDEKVGPVPVELVSRHAPENNFSANIIAMHSQNSGETNLNNVLESYKASIATDLAGGIVLSDTIYKIADQSVAFITYRGTAVGSNIKVMELLFIRKNRDIQIVFTDLEQSFDTRTEFIETKNSLNFF